ncbi:MAG TPA: hypothetical protein VFV98_07840 [Vicinamibacterales bacterium]|nr:hypothetical protein [Vicinamibacterales bacterium]
MKRASITETKNQLSALLDRVRTGESILIEDRGIAVAQLTPMPRVSGLDRDRVAALERQGILRPARASCGVKVLLTAPPAPARPVSLSRLVAAEREESW